MHPGWELQEEVNPVPRKRNSGLPGTNVRENTNETFRRIDEDDVAAAIVASGGGGGGLSAAPAQVKTPDEPPLAEIIDRLHKSSFYIAVAHDHPASNPDPVPNPGYAPKGQASTIKAGYALAKAIAASEGKRCPVLVIDGGGPWFEDLTFDSPAVDLIGWGGRPQIVGNCKIVPNVSDFMAHSMRFTSATTNEALRLLPAPFLYPKQPNGGLVFSQCHFDGPVLALYAQRPFFGVDSLFWSSQRTDPFAAQLGLETAPLVCEIDQPQTFFTWLRRCRFEAFSQTTPSEWVSMIPYGFAIRASARRDAVLNGPWQMQMYSANGDLRVRTDVDTGVGQVTTGLILEDCDVNGSLLCEGWYVSHLGGWQRGAVTRDSSGVAYYAVVRGHDWVFNVLERQFGFVQFDHSKVLSSHVAVSEDDPLLRASNFPGGTGIWFRHSSHLTNTSFAAVHAGRGGVDTFFETQSSSPAAQWTTGTLVNANGININSNIMWHPLAV